MVVTVEATTTRGKQLTPAEWAAVERACSMCLELDNARRRILEYVESRIRFLAPNLSAIVGSRTATKLLGIAGGLTGLSKMPSANIYVSHFSQTPMIACMHACHRISACTLERERA